jgi:hypothetical protein
MIINDLVVGVYDKQLLSSITECNLQTQMTHMWNSTTGTIYLKSTDGAPVQNFKSFYPGFDMLGKHFKLRSTSNQKLNRHYTICNVMRPTYYQALVKSLRNGDDSDFGRHLLDSTDKPI